MAAAPRRRRAGPLAAWLVLAALLLPPAAPEAAPGAAPAPAPDPAQGSGGHPQRLPYRVLESFAVGKGVYVRALTVDARRGLLWVGTSVGALGVDLRTREPRYTFTRKEGLANEYVFAVHVDGRGDVWFGTNGGGMSRYRPADGSWRTYFPMHGLADYWVYAFADAPDGGLWVGTWAGASLLDPARRHFTNYVKELVNEWVYGVAVDGRGRVWFGTEGGVSVLDGGRWRSYTHADGLGAPNEEGLPVSLNTGLGTRSRHNLSVMRGGRPTYNPNYVFCLLVDRRDGSLWAGTWGGGAAHLVGGRWRNLTRRDGLGGNIVFSMAQAPDGSLWFGTNGGLSHYDPQAPEGRRWRTFTTRDGLYGDSVFAVAATPSGEVWAGTRQGVARLGRAAPEGGR